ncbi:MAG: amidohydrolase, partial [Chryseotalea sp.]
MRKQYRLWQLMLLVCWCLATNLQAQDEVVLTPVTKTYAITNVNINQAPGKKIEMGTILIKDGVIKAVGKNITIPADAWVIKADSMQAYAGFIDGFSRTGVTKPKEEGRERLKDPGNPPPDKAGITPQSDVRTFINPADKAIDEWRNAGFTLAHVAPYGGMLPGQTALILLGGTGTDNMVLQNNAALYSELTPAERMYPNTIIGVMAKFRELYQQASLTKSYEAVYASNRNGLERPQPDRVLQAFYPVIDKKQAVAFKAEKVLDVQRVINLQKDLGFNLTLVDVKEGWDVINKIKNANAKVFLSLDLPEKKKEDKKEEKKEDKKHEKKENKPDKPKTATELEKEALD